MVETQNVSGVNLKTTLNTVGLNLTAFQFKEGKNVGYFANDSFDIPLGGKISANGNSIDYSYSNADSKISIEMIVGPAFKKTIDENQELYYGYGPSLHELAVTLPSGSAALSLSLGLGGTLGVKMNISDNMYWDVGVVSNVGLFNYSISDLNPDGSFNNILTLSVTPHIGLGFVRHIKIN